MVHDHDRGRRQSWVILLVSWKGEGLNFYQVAKGITIRIGRFDALNRILVAACGFVCLTVRIEGNSPMRVSGIEKDTKSGIDGSFL
jgi:hypothetical protein